MYFLPFAYYLIHLHGVRVEVDDFENLVLRPRLEKTFVALER